MTKTKTTGLTRRGLLGAFAATAVTAAPTFANAAGFLRGAGDVRRTDEPYMMLSGYRSPQTNAMLRSQSRGVAKNSLHMKGQAADLRIQGRSTTQMARAARSCRAGGVGQYSGSNFVHMDCGVVRSWGS